MKRHIHKIPRAKVLEGITSFNRVNGNELRDETWDVLCRLYHEETVDDDLWDDFEQVDEVDAKYDCQESVPEDVEEVEKVASMEFQPLGVIAGPNDLYTQEDGSTAPQVKSEFKSIFVHSASPSFLAYLPLAFWRKVAENTTAYAAAQKRPRVSLDEMMKFLGIIFYMALIDKGEYANYRGDQVEDTIFDSDSIRLDPVMALKPPSSSSPKHFLPPQKVYRRPHERSSRAHLTPNEHVEAPGAKVCYSWEERCCGRVRIACRSRFARHLIVFNATKPTGKYHFKIYMCCCSESWLMANFRLHCASNISERLNGVVTSAEAHALEQATKRAGEVRKFVMEVTRPIRHSNRIVNTDNYYTSCQLLEMLRVYGMYGRGTIRENSKHFPRCVTISMKDNLPRG